MKNIISDYLKLKNEIDEFYTLLGYIENPFSKIVINDHESVEQSFSNTAITTLKATAFLLLYNLVESTIRRSVEKIMTTIYEKNIKYFSLTEKAKIQWIQLHAEKLKKADQISFSNKIFDFIDKTVKGEPLDFTSLFEGFGGNLDAREIRNICERWGIKKPTKGDLLLKVKEHRNALAHGKKNFSDLGKNYSFQQLEETKNNVFSFLTEMLGNVEKFLDSELFLENRTAS